MHISKIISIEAREGLAERLAEMVQDGIRDELFAVGMKVATEQEEDGTGRWIGEVEGLPGALAYGATKDEACAKAKALALEILADRLKHGEDIPEEFDLSVYAS